MNDANKVKDDLQELVHEVHEAIQTNEDKNMELMRKWKADDEQLEKDFSGVVDRLKHGITSVKRDGTQLQEQMNRR